MWSGRFREPTSRFVQKYNASLFFDRTICHCDIKTLSAHSKMLWVCGALELSELLSIEAGLNSVNKEIGSKGFEWKLEYEDVHRNIERRVIELVGRPGKKMHTGKSRNDQVATTMRLWVILRIGIITVLLKKLCRDFIQLAKQHLNTIFPGLTHSQVAQPITLGHHFQAYGEMLRRDIIRLKWCRTATSQLPLGSAALAGSNYSIERTTVALLLNFKRVCRNSLDAVSDRDFILEYQFCLAIIMIHLSRFSEEMISWLSSINKLIDIGDAYCTGSSIMPQKKNPDVLELIRGKVGGVISNLMSIMITMKAQNLSYNKDNQEDKRVAFATSKVSGKSIEVLGAILKTLSIRKAVVRRIFSLSFSTATDLADYLTKQGLTFRDAHEVTSRIVRACLDSQQEIEELTTLDLRNYIPLNVLAQLRSLNIFRLKNSVFSKDHLGGSSPKWCFSMLRKYEKEELCRI